MPTKFYPPVTDLIDASALPGDLQVLENAINEAISVILSKTYFKDYDVQVRKSGDSKFYSLTLVTKSLRQPIITDLNLVIFKGNESSLTEIPIAIEWTWPLAKYFPKFDVLSFTGTPEAFLDILIEMSGIESRDEFIFEIVNVFLNDGSNAYQEFFTNIIPIINLYDNGVTGVSAEISNIISQTNAIKDELENILSSSNWFSIRDIYENYQDNTIISAAVDSISDSITTLENDHNISIDVFGDVIKTLLEAFTDVDEKFDRLLKFFKNWLGDIDKDDIESFLIPHIRAELRNINIGLEFPRNWLVPMIEQPIGSGNYIVDPVTSNLATLDFSAGNLSYSTRYGFSFNNIPAFNFNRTMIANTGFTIEIDNAKIDLWENKNILEANADGRPETFKGIYIESIEIGLPPSLTPEAGQPAYNYIKGTNLIIGTEGGLSGIISLEGTSLRAEIASLVLELTNFDIEFHQNSVENFDIKADLYIPGVKATVAGTDSLGNTYEIGDPGPIGLDITYTAPNYTIAVVSNPQIDIFGIDLTIHTLTFGFDSDSLNSLVFHGELFIPHLKAKTAGSNTYSSWIAGAPAPILLETTYTSSPEDTFTFTASDIPAINLLGFELDIASCGFSIIDGDLDALSVSATLLIPGVKDTGTGNQAPIGLSVTYNEPDYTFEATSFPTLNIFTIGLEIHELTIGFNKSSINTFDFKGELYLPNLKADGPGYNPKGSFVNGAPAPIYFETSYSEVGPNKTFSVTATDIPQIKILGLGIDIRSLAFEILNGNLSGFAIESFLFIPGVKAVSGGTYGTIPATSYSAGDLAPIGVTVNYSEPEFSIAFDAVPAIKIFGMEMEIFQLDLAFDDSAVTNFILKSEIKIPNLLVRTVDGGGIYTENGTLLVEGAPYPIAINTAYTGGSSDIFTFSTLSGATFDFFGLEITIPSLGFTIEDGTLAALAFAANVELPGLSGEMIEVNFSYSGSDYTVGMATFPPVVTLSLGSVEFDFTSFTVSWNETGVTASDISGQMRVDGHNINFTMGFTPEGWEIFAEDLTGVGFTIPNVLGVTIYALKIGKRNGNFFVEVGEPSNMDSGDNTLGAALENLLDIPLVGKYLPSNLDIGFLSFEAGSGIDLNNAELKLLWPELEGLTLSSTGTGLEAVIPINKTIFKTITINTLTVSMSNEDLTGDGQNETVLKALMDGTLEIGPILGTVSGIGLEAIISYPTGGGNLGAANIDHFGIAGPDGIGLSIDTAGIKGGGYLSFNKDKGEYAGYLGLTIQDKISLNAIAILNTKFPDGSSGISLLIILTVEFNPGIQLGFGFNLSGLGGLFGLHRTMEIEPLRTGVKNGTIDHILFPDPTTFVQNAATHLSNIKAIFPVDHGRFVFGPMAKIGWGTPTLITAEVGLLLEVPKPVRLAILGVIKAILPDEDNDLIRLQINFLGLIDFGKKFISFDATIFDSKILTFAISGDMAFRLHYGDNPAFLLSVGGFHPKFNSPIPVPSMNRLMVKIVDKQKLRVILSTYFAVTSNTVQFGAKIDLYAKIGSISAIGYFGLDTLFQFSPFYMIASISAGVAIRYKDFDLAAIYLSGELEGPTPWKVNGTATFKIIGIEKSFSMSETFGEERTVTYESVDITSLVVEAIDDPTNWQVTTGGLQDGNVVLKAQSTATNIISANGTLSITQRVVPLNYTIQKYGNRVPSGARTFSIASVAFGSGVTVMADLQNIKDDFASAEYKNIDKSTKLSIPSFEKMDGGVKVNPPAGGLDFGGDNASTVSSQRDAVYEKTLIDFVPDPVNPLIFNVKYDRSTYLLKNTWLKREVRGGAAAKSSASKTRSKLYGKTDQRVSIGDETFAVVSTDDLTTTYTAKTRLEAEELMEFAINADPTLEGQLQIITNHRTL